MKGGKNAISDTFSGTGSIGGIIPLEFVGGAGN